MANFQQSIYKFLRWTQKYTGTDNVYLVKGGFWLTLGQFASMGLFFLLAIAFANLLSKQTYGTYQYILSVFGILAISNLGSMGPAIIQAVARGYEGSLIPGLKTKIRWSLLGTLASLILASYYYLMGNPLLATGFVIVALFLPVKGNLPLYLNLLQGKKKFDVFTQYTVIIKIIATAIMIACLFLTKNVLLIVFTFFAVHTLLQYIFFRLTLKKFPPNQKQNPQTIPYGKYLSFTGIILRTATELDNILLWHFLGPIQVAIYSFATAPPGQIRDLLSKNIGTLALPKLSQRPVEELKASLPQKVFKLTLIIFPIVVLYILLAPFVYKAFFPQYLDSILYSRFFSLSLLFIPISLLNRSFIAKMKKKEVAIVRSISPALRILLLFILVPLYGILGVISAILIVGGFHSLLVFSLFKRM